MGFGLSLACCCGDSISPITLKAFDEDGAVLYEYWVANVVESHSGMMYGLEIRELTSANWSSFSRNGPTVGFGSSSISQPTKSGTNPYSNPLKQYALDAISIDRATGARTLLHANVDYVFAEYDSSASPGLLKLGLPVTTTTNNRSTQAYRVTDDGTCCLTSPIINNGILFFDDWVQSTTSRYRIVGSWMKANGSPSEWTFTNGASSATFAINASAATIETALESITGVVSATVTGGPLPFANVDIEVVWTTNTGRFTSIALQRTSATGRAIYSFADGKFTGRAEYTVPLGSIDCITSDNLSAVTGNARRHDITSDANGVLIPTATAWSVTAINTSRAPICSGLSISPGVIRAAHGKVLVHVNRSNGTGGLLTHVVLDESTGALEAAGDAVMDVCNQFFADSTNIAIYGIDDCGARMTGGEQYATIPTSGGSASASWMIQGEPTGFTTTDGYLCSTVVGTAEDGLSYADFSSELDASTTVTATNTTVGGGDAFFSGSYIRRNIAFSSPPTLWNNTTEWRILEYTSGGVLQNTTAWFAYGDGDATVEAEVDAWYGNNSDGLPVIQIPFATTDNSITPLMWFQRGGAALLITASNVPADIAAHNLANSTRVYRVELRDANVRFQKAICRVRLSDSTVIWQRDLGEFLTGGPSIGSYAVTYDQGVIVAHSTTPRKSATTPTIVSGPLP
jgi:hypothetical protein